MTTTKKHNIAPPRTNRTHQSGRTNVYTRNFSQQQNNNTTKNSTVETNTNAKSDVVRYASPNKPTKSTVERKAITPQTMNGSTIQNNIITANPVTNTRLLADSAKTVGSYALGETIGKGTFGKVKRGTHLITGETVAVKILEKSKIREIADVERVSREIQILKKVRHKNVVRLFEVIDSPRDIYLMMEYINGGELFDYIVDKTRLDEPEACMFFNQICEGVNYLHHQFVIHRDLKPENLLMHKTAKGWVIKVADFGLSNTNNGNKLLKTACGSPCYAAPEMIAGHRYDGVKSDIWSLGVVLYALVCGYLPFEDDNTNMLYKKILKAYYKCPKFISNDVKDLIAKILNTDPKERYNFVEIRSHPWFKRHMKDSITDFMESEPSPTDHIHLDVKKLNPQAVSQLEALGISKSELTESINKNCHNQAVTTYFLLLEKIKRERRIRDQNIPKQKSTNSKVESKDKRPSLPNTTGSGQTSKTQPKVPEKPHNSQGKQGYVRPSERTTSTTANQPSNVQAKINAINQSVERQHKQQQVLQTRYAKTTHKVIPKRPFEIHTKHKEISEKNPSRIEMQKNDSTVRKVQDARSPKGTRASKSRFPFAKTANALADIPKRVISPILKNTYEKNEIKAPRRPKKSALSEKNGRTSNTNRSGRTVVKAKPPGKGFTKSFGESDYHGALIKVVHTRSIEAKPAKNNSTKVNETMPAITTT